MSAPPPRTFYDILNVAPNVSFDELKKSYKQLILQNHPDKLVDNRITLTTQTQTEAETRTSENPAALVPNNDNKFVEINKAWNTLKDPVQRKLYDAELIATRFQEQSNIFANVKLAELNVDHCHQEEDVIDNGTTTQMFTYNCRCGGQYVVDESVAREALQIKNSEILVECSECSLNILVND